MPYYTYAPSMERAASGTYFEFTDEELLSTLPKPQPAVNDETTGLLSSQNTTPYGTSSDTDATSVDSSSDKLQLQNGYFAAMGKIMVSVIENIQKFWPVCVATDPGEDSEE